MGLQFHIMYSYSYMYMYLHYACRVIKQAMKASGSNLTQQHMVDVSLSGLFLLHAAKQVQHALKTSFQSSFHTATDASGDIRKMVTYLLEEKATIDIRIVRALCLNAPIRKVARKWGPHLTNS